MAEGGWFGVRVSSGDWQIHGRAAEYRGNGKWQTFGSSGLARNFGAVFSPRNIAEVFSPGINGLGSTGSGQRMGRRETGQNQAGFPQDRLAFLVHL